MKHGKEDKEDKRETTEEEAKTEEVKEVEVKESLPQDEKHRKINYEARAADQQGCSSNHYENILKYILIHFNLS